MISDWSENFSELLMIEAYLDSGLISQTLVSVGSGINSFKWVMSSLTYLILIVGIILADKIINNQGINILKIRDSYI